jgi:phage terminase large subunit
VPTAPAAAPPDPRRYVAFGDVILDFARYRGRESVLEGPADTGKSRACLEYVHAACEKYPGCQWAIVRQTRSSITETAQKTYEKWVRPEGAARLWHDLEYRYPNGSVVVLAGMDEASRILSSEFDGIYVQQAEELDADTWEILTTRVTGRGAVMPYTRLIADMNPTDPGFHLYQREADGHVRFFQVRHADNPAATPERVAALATLTGHRRDRLFLGLRVAAEGMFFEEWDPRVHVVDPFPIPAHWTRWTSTDYGFAAPFCHLAFARDPQTRRVYVHRELYAAGLRDADQAELVARRLREERADLGRTDTDPPLYSRHVADPSMFAKRAEQNRPSIASVYAAHGVPLVAGGNNRKHGWSVVRAALATEAVDPDTGERTPTEPRLYVFRDRCPNLVRTLPAMVVDPLDPEDLADALRGKKTEDHAVDALRYGLVLEATSASGGSTQASFTRGR